ncbi:MAG: alpha/beta hydrolase [Azospirillaceae bacterium]|nr:alpha/beta hydrolase [Azospirillaceae bacterium]
MPARWVHATGLALVLAITPPASAQTAPDTQMADAGRWSVWGSSPTFMADDQMPGGTVVSVAAYGPDGVDWSNGAGMMVPHALKAGDRISGVFWARSARPARVLATLQGQAPGYAVLALAPIDLTPTWTRYTISGVASSDLAAGTQFLTLQLGKAAAGATLGPVLFMAGEPDDTRIQATFAHFQPVEVVRDVRIPSDPGVTLAGRLRLPGRHGPGPFPVVILLNGSGPGRRGVFPRIEDRLLADGIATLDYDKRGVGESTGDFVDTLELMERDATAAVAYLRARPDVDGARIGFLGLSQGGVVGPGAAANDPRIAAIVMLAGPVGAKGTMFLDAMANTLAAGGMAADRIAPIIAAARTLMEARAAGASPTTAARQALLDAFIAAGWTPEQAGGALATLDTPVTLSMYLAPLDDVLAKVRAPVLAVYAGDDHIVSTPKSMAAAEVALRGNPDATVVELPGLDHVFHEPGLGDISRLPVVPPAAAAPEMVDLVGRWLDARLRPAPPVD